jgi:hypothetical protein
MCLAWLALAELRFASRLSWLLFPMCPGRMLTPPWTAPRQLPPTCPVLVRPCLQGQQPLRLEHCLATERERLRPLRRQCAGDDLGHLADEGRAGQGVGHSFVTASGLEWHLTGSPALTAVNPICCCCMSALPQAAMLMGHLQPRLQMDSLGEARPLLQGCSLLLHK